MDSISWRCTAAVARDAYLPSRGWCSVSRECGFGPIYNRSGPEVPRGPVRGASVNRKLATMNRP
jgi:hypothetical protein